ncbi:flagellin [Aurantimonas sp. DM33-3]|uniref:flagellin N-terminal helical domain-containing protein n=1 Tax=Aurantimonas sp. DM33-3 TaxID=2766955 RepID=UPI001652A1A6|nr:flagellin [Aurantimonas sp. DM33-3]MBC6718792.1 flagellin [Aurantimonas sp. DM33-3]
MTSINTNVSAMTALQSLSMINSNLDQTQNRISTGYRVGAASDNAAYWSIATTMRSDNKALGAVEDALGLGQAKVDVAYTGLNAAIDVVDEIKSKLVAAKEPGVDRDKIQSEIGELQKQLGSIAKSASFSGENWLSVNSDTGVNPSYQATKSVVSSFNRDSAGDVSVSTIDINTASTALFDENGAASGILDGTFVTTGATPLTVSVFNLDVSVATVDDQDLSDMIDGVENALGLMTTAASNLGAAKNRMDIQSEFVSNLRDSIEKGVGTLVDADMTEESTRLKALQTQQQLGVQALSIANSSSQSILSLFR